MKTLLIANIICLSVTLIAVTISFVELMKIDRKLVKIKKSKFFEEKETNNIIEA